MEMNPGGELHVTHGDNSYSHRVHCSDPLIQILSWNESLVVFVSFQVQLETSPGNRKNSSQLIHRRQQRHRNRHRNRQCNLCETVTACRANTSPERELLKLSFQVAEAQQRASQLALSWARQTCQCTCWFPGLLCQSAATVKPSESETGPEPGEDLVDYSWHNRYKQEILGGEPALCMDENKWMTNHEKRERRRRNSALNSWEPKTSPTWPSLLLNYECATCTGCLCFALCVWLMRPPYIIYGAHEASVTNGSSGKQS